MISIFLIWANSLFTFKVSIDMVGFKSTIF